jgi:hypothetical protein
VTSRDNVEIVREALAHYWQAGDPRAFAERFWEADSDYYPVRKFPEARPCHGRDEIVQFHLAFRDVWESYEILIKELIPVADDRVLAQVTLTAEGRESGVAMGGDLYHCIWLRHGRVYRWEDHLTVSGAIQSLGLDGDTLKSAGLVA